VRIAAYQSGQELDHEAVRLLSDSLQERLPGTPEDAYLEGLNYRVGQLCELIRWLATERG